MVAAFSFVMEKWSIDKTLYPFVFHALGWEVRSLQSSLPGSSVAEQVTVNHLVVGSTPTRAAILAQQLTRCWAFLNLHSSGIVPPIGLTLPMLSCRR